MSSDKQNITIRLAGLPKIPLAVERQDEEMMRQAERMVNDLWGRWHQTTFAAEPHLKVMARVAFQFAVLYLRGERDKQRLQELDSRLEQILAEVQQPRS